MYGRWSTAIRKNASSTILSFTTALLARRCYCVFISTIRICKRKRSKHQDPEFINCILERKKTSSGNNSQTMIQSGPIEDFKGYLNRGHNSTTCKMLYTFLERDDVLLILILCGAIWHGGSVYLCRKRIAVDAIN